MPTDIVWLKNLEIADEEFTLKLRNDNKEYFYNDKTIAKEFHGNWLRDQIQSKTSYFFIIMVNRKKIGTISFSVLPQMIEIGNILIDIGFRGQGYGSKAITQVLAMALRENPNKPIRLSVKYNNGAAQRLYRSLGFIDAELIMEYKLG